MWGVRRQLNLAYPYPHQAGDRTYQPAWSLLQWHITERCNLRCAHCYQDAYGGSELDFDGQLAVVEQYKDLLAFWRDRTDRVVNGHITVTGGEPFAHRNFLDLLEVFAANRRRFSFAILTNGSFIDRTMARRLRQLGPRFVQVSIEGTKATHDSIRGDGNFERTVAAIRYLRDARMPTMISFTAHRGNFREFPAVAWLGCRLGVDKVWSDRLIPHGSGAAMREHVLTPDETREYFTIMARARKMAQLTRILHGTEIAMNRALQFMADGGAPYHCAAGDNLVTVQPNGDLYPCRRMPISVGNVMQTPLIDLYYGAGLFRTLRDPFRIAEGCLTCEHAPRCRGGLKCLSCAVTGDPFQPDPGCWRAARGSAERGKRNELVSG